jgi:regulator of cell morphogenesis and NO signaling
MSVGSIVNDNFAAARVFKYFGIDFCCGGAMLLVDACRNAGVDVDAVCAALADSHDSSRGAIPFASWPTDLLIDYVLKIHHRGIRSKGPRLLADIEHVAAVHGDVHPELLQLKTLFAQSLDDLENHLQKEEQVLFPYCCRLIEAQQSGVAAEAMHCGTVANPIRVMHREHSDEGLRYKFIRNLMNDYAVPADACPSYRLMLEDLERFMDALFEHIHLENNILFPRFVALEQSCVRG